MIDSFIAQLLFTKKKKAEEESRERASILLLGKDDHEMTVSWYFQTFSIKIKFVVCNRKFQSLYSCAYHENSDSLMVQYDSPVFSVQFSSVAQSCPTLCDPMNHSTPDLPVHHQLPKFTQTHIHRVVMPSSHLILCRPLLLLPSIPPSIRVFSHESALRMRWPKYWSFSFSIIPSKEIQGWSPSEWTGWISLESKGLSRVFSNTTVQKHQFFSAQPSSQSNSPIHTWPQEKP